MKTIGLIGGTAWESTVDYYRLLNLGVRAKLGGFHSCKIVLTSVDFAIYESWMRKGEWDVLAAALGTEARKLEAAGAEVILLCTNTMHKVAGVVAATTPLPFLDIRDVTARAIVAAGCKKPLLLGTRYTMENDFFTAHLGGFGLSPLVPSAADQQAVNAIIFEELVKGVVSPASKAKYLDIIAKAQGADSVIFGCTEIGMLLKPADLALPCFDTMRLHVDAALNFSI